jgi:hypothetical protein
MPIWNAIHLGAGSIIDPTEGNTLAENAGLLVGQTFGGPGNALAGDIVQVETFDTSGNDALDQNNSIANEVFTADIGAGTQSFTFDAATAYGATITYLDGTSVNTTVVLFQDVTGQTFLAPGLSAAANAPLIAGPIQSVTINAVVTNSALGLATVRPTIDFVPCFAAGTLIRTAKGARPVEDLRAGDMVWTRDAGLQPLVWVGARAVAGLERFAPVRFAPGAMGNLRALTVSPQHRMLVAGWRAELMFGEPEVLVAAAHLVNGDTICRVPVARVSYHHIMFDGHHVIEAEGAAAESFYAGDVVRAGDVAIWAELVELFPELAWNDPAARPAMARPVVKGAEGRILAHVG